MDVDADFAGGRLSGKSTSGGLLNLVRPQYVFPLSLGGKKADIDLSIHDGIPSRLSCTLTMPRGLAGTATLGIAIRTWCSVALKVLEDYQATILVVRKGYSPKLRHITRAHGVNLSALSEVFHNDSAELEYCKPDITRPRISSQKHCRRKNGGQPYAS